MKLFQMLLFGDDRRQPAQRPATAPSSERPKPVPTVPKPVKSARSPGSARPARSAQQRYDRLVTEMKRRHGIRVHRWRSSTSGCAWQVRYRDGRVVRLIQSPYPRGPMSAAVFLHEVGHHVIGFDRYKPRCLEEFMAWQWALAAMEAHGVQITARVRTRVDRSLRYAVAKARRRGLKRLPPELARYASRRAPSPNSC